MRNTAALFFRAALLHCVFVIFADTAFAEIVSGKVLSPDGKPVSGAIVIGQYPTDSGTGFMWPRETPPVRTNAEGAFQIELDTTVILRPPAPNQPALKPHLLAGAAGFAPVAFPVKSGEAHTIRLRPAATLRGVVNDGDNKPVAGARVRVAVLGTESNRNEDLLFLPNALADRYTSTTDAQGRYTVRDVPTTGNAFVLLTDDRYGMVFARATLKPGVSEVPTFVARPAGIVTGRVMLPDGKPAVGVRVRASGAGVGSSPFADFKTDATGTYRISGLAAGTFAVQADTSTSFPNLKGLEVVNQVVSVGKTTTAGDLKLLSAATVIGKVTDAETNQPLAGVRIVVGTDSAMTDSGGEYRLQAIAGNQDVLVTGAPEGYVVSARAAARLTSGASHTQNFALKRGVIVTGVLRTADTQPVQNVSVGVRSGDVQLTTVTDADGRFSFSGIERGMTTFVLHTDLWELDGRADYAVPAREGVVLRVKKSNVLPISGRVLNPAGKPMSGVTVRVTLEAKDGQSTSNFTLTTDNAGQYTVRARGEFTKASVMPAQSGYRFVRGGEFKAGRDGSLAFEDIVVSVPTGKRTGRVVDAVGKPVAGALTLAAEGGKNSLTMTDAQGRFTLSDLPEGETQVFAAHRAGFISATVSTADKTAPTLTLSPVAAPVPPNPANALARLESLWQEGKTHPTTPRSLILQTMAVLDPDRALKLDDNLDNPSDQTKETIFTALSAVDPNRAIAWILPRLSEIRSAGVRQSIDYGLAKAAFQTARTNDALMLYGSLKTDFEEMRKRGVPPTGYELARLAGLAAYARDPEAESLARRALETLRGEMERRGDDRDDIDDNARLMVFGEVAEASPRLVESLSRDLPRSIRANALANLIRQCSRTNLTTARTLLPVLREADGADGSLYSTVARTVVGQLAARNLTDALELARSLPDATDKSLALAACATRIKVPAQRTALFREAFAPLMGPANGSVKIGAAARVAAMAFPLDPALGTRLFAETRSKLPSVWNRDDNSVVHFAFYYARVNRGESRALLESVWERRKGSTGAVTASPSSVITAMAAADFARASEMADSLPAGRDREYEMFVTRVKIAQYLAFPSAVRRSLPFEQWTRSDIWHPGTGDE